VAFHYLQGFYNPKHPEKYHGKDVKSIVYRSGLELKCMMYFDNHKDVLYWSSEEVIVSYISPKDGRNHRYYPDFIIKMKNKNGIEEIVMIEIKPSDQIREPKPIPPNKKPTKRMINEILTYGINKAKWAAAEEYCRVRGWKWMIMDEKDIKGL
jgi:hypothetical protein